MYLFVQSIIIGLLCKCAIAQSWADKDVALRAVVKDAVVDLFTELPVQERVPLAGAGYADGTCRRAHQLLANEVMTVLERQGQYVKTGCDNAVCGLQNGVPLNTFWIHKKHIFALKHFDEQQLAAVPGPWDGAGDTLVLRFPW